MVAIHFPPELPVSQRRDEIAAAIREHQVVIVAGETGSGKTTQLPKICLELGRTAIGHTQPRRIAARTIAERIAEELGGKVGELVGYQVRFTDASSESTRIKLMTDGILLGELRRDRLLRRYDTIIIDEAHERSLNIDFLLGYLKRLLPERPDLKLIITSATIDPESFSKHFDDAPVIEVSGRTYPVEVRYRPLVGEASTDDEEDAQDAPSATDDRDVNEGIVAGLRELAGERAGDVLVFLPGEREIREAEAAIRASLSTRELEATELLPLYGRLSAHDQHRVFEPSKRPGVRRRVVLATNVAETSLTVPGIAYVIDAGLARISRYSVRAKVQRLPIEAISQASANQRSGRSGRTRDGIAIRLYSEEDFERRPEFTDPEILRTNLASVLLQMLELGLGAIEDFPFLTPPDSRGVKDGVDLLRELGAIRGGTGRGVPQLTKTGRQLASLPIEPRFARMVVEAKRLDVARDVLIIVAGLTVQDIRERPLEQRAKADQLHARFRDPSSDFMSLLKLWSYLEEQQRELGSSAFRRLCKAEFLNYVRLREWQDLFRQLRETAKPLGLRIQRPDAGAEPGANADAVHRALLSGLLSHIGVFDRQRRDYRGARNTRFRVFPGSGLKGSNPEAVMAAELVETSQLFARTVAKIKPEWAESLAGELAKRQHSEPHWERKQGQAVALETVTLYGVPIVTQRRVGFAAIDPSWSRDLFIRHALVEGDWTGRYPFVRRNQQLLRDVAEFEERTRTRSRHDDTEVLFEFFDERLPADVVSQPTFDQWWRVAQQEQPKLLDLRRGDLLEDDDATENAEAYPRTWQQGEQQLRLRYKFDPQAPDDGVTAVVPVQLLAMLTPDGFDWQVPGLREELVTALLRTLPKATRRNFVPAADWAARLLDQVGEVRPDRGEPVTAPLTEVLHGHLQRLGGIRFDAGEFEPERVPAHLRMRFLVLDDRGRELGEGSNLLELQQRLKRQSEAALVRATEAPPTPSNRRGRGGRKDAPGSDAKAAAEPSRGSTESVAEQRELTGWPERDLPETFEIRRKNGVIRAWPTLQLRDAARPATSKVDLVLATTSADQVREHPRAVAVLLARSVPSPVTYVLAHLTSQEKLALAASPYPSTEQLLADATIALAQRTVDAAGEPVRTKAAFDAMREQFNAELIDALFEVVRLVGQVLTAHRDALRAVKSSNAMAYLATLTDVRGQLEALVFDGFVSRTGLEQLQHLPRYLRAATARIERLSMSAATERAGAAELEQAFALFRDAGGTLPLALDAPEQIVAARWLLEEFRVSLFAQQLGTAQPASLKRLRKLLGG